jgi:hypothetical protein
MAARLIDLPPRRWTGPQMPARLALASIQRSMTVAAPSPVVLSVDGGCIRKNVLPRVRHDTWSPQAIDIHLGILGIGDGRCTENQNRSDNDLYLGQHDRSPV